jgi:hypothetical protein
MQSAESKESSTTSAESSATSAESSASAQAGASKSALRESTEMNASALRESTVGRELVAGVIAAAIALGCVLPPLVHFVTGPLGPAIGGYVVAHHVKPGARGRVIIAAVLGLCLAAIGAGAATAVLAFGGDKRPDWFPSREQIGLVLLGVFVYAGALGAVGATLGARTGKAE